jgi:hypothetical protein
MANSAYTPLEGCLANATERQAVYAASKCDLYKEALSPDPSTPLTAYVAALADYDTYVQKTFTLWFDPGLAPGGGYLISSPAVQWDVGLVDPATQNLIGGFFMRDAGGSLRLAGIFDPSIPMQFAGQIVPLQIFDLFGTGV